VHPFADRTKDGAMSPKEQLRPLLAFLLALGLAACGGEEDNLRRDIKCSDELKVSTDQMVAATWQASFYVESKAAGPDCERDGNGVTWCPQSGEAAHFEVTRNPDGDGAKGAFSARFSSERQAAWGGRRCRVDATSDDIVDTRCGAEGTIQLHAHASGLSELVCILGAPRCTRLVPCVPDRDVDLEG